MTATKHDLIVGIDASRMDLRNRTGTENYSNQIIRGLIDLDSNWRWRLYLNTVGSGHPGDIPEGVDVRTLSARRFWTHHRLSREMLTHRPDLLFVPSHVIPVIHPRTIVTIHDLGYLHVPDAHPSGQRRMLDLTTRWSTRVAHHIIAPSTRTARDLVEHYHVSEDRVSVVYHGVEQRFRDVDISGEAEIRQQHNLQRPFVLAVGTVQPRKNLGVLARALASTQLDHDLVIAGKRGWMADAVVVDLRSAGLGERLHLLDYVPDADLPNLYAAADVFVQPSRFEGFGMPVLEAMAAGTPVICAEGSSLTEIAGDAAVFFPPEDCKALAHELERLCRNTDARREAIDRGRSWSCQFTWERAARETRTIVELALT